jgi:hypothetical protein
MELNPILGRRISLSRGLCKTQEQQLISREGFWGCEKQDIPTNLGAVDDDQLETIWRSEALNLEKQALVCARPASKIEGCCPIPSRK